MMTFSSKDFKFQTSLDQDTNELGIKFIPKFGTVTMNDKLIGYRIKSGTINLRDFYSTPVSGSVSFYIGKSIFAESRVNEDTMSSINSLKGAPPTKKYKLRVKIKKR